MSETKGRKVHQPEFKAKVGLEAIRGVKTVNEIGQEFGVHPTLVNQWKREIQEQASTLFDVRRGVAPARVNLLSDYCKGKQVVQLIMHPI